MQLFNFGEFIYLFNSFTFLIFFLIIFLLYWLLPNKFRNLFLLTASYIFYALWDWRFLGLLIFSTIVDYFCGKRIYSSGKAKKKIYLGISIVTNLSLLGFFKYFNFFIENIEVLLNGFGIHTHISTLNIILPLGISFYTFQKLSYTLDIYKGKLKPTKKIINFSLFVSYFPQLIAGPIERAKDLIPQIRSKKYFKNLKFREGIYLFTYGLFKKIVIADSVSIIVNNILSSSNPTGTQVLINIYAFALQLYCDFSGYSNMARGISLFFGIKLTTNFNLPFFSKNPAEFFKRWHITLSSWITDYVYFPLFFKLSSKLNYIKSIKYYISGFISGLITMIIFGFWHGAAWNFIITGVYLFTIIVIYQYARIFFSKIVTLTNKFLLTIFKIFNILITFHLISFGLLLLRLKNLSQILLISQALFSGINFNNMFHITYWYFYLSVIFLFIYELLQYLKKDELFISKQNFYIQVLFYNLLFFLTLNIGAVLNTNFIYFQF